MTITESQRLQLIGLRELCNQTLAEQRRLADAVAGIIGEEQDQYGYYALTDDWVYEKDAPVGRLIDASEARDNA